MCRTALIAIGMEGHRANVGQVVVCTPEKVLFLVVRVCDAGEL